MLPEAGAFLLGQRVHSAVLFHRLKVFEATSEEAVETASGSPIVQGSLEMSNVNVVEEIVGLITNYRAYEIAQRKARLQDQTLHHSNNDFGAAI